MTELEHLKTSIDRFIARNRMTPTVFGREALNDPKFVFTLRDGREPRAATREKVLRFIKKANTRKGRESTE